MQYLKLLYILVLIVQFTSISGVMKWFNFKKDDKDDKEDCEPEIVAIRKTKVLPIAVPVYNRKRVYSVKTRKSRRKHENDEETAEQDKRTQSNYAEEEDEEKSEDVDEKSDRRQEVRQENKNDSTNERSTNDRSTNDRSTFTDKRPHDNLKPRSDNLFAHERTKSIVRDELDDPDEQESMDYEIDELIKNAIDRDDDDIEDLIENDDL